jgi:hypothetical protein
LAFLCLPDWAAAEVSRGGNARCPCLAERYEYVVPTLVGQVVKGKSARVGGKGMGAEGDPANIYIRIRYIL